MPDMAITAQQRKRGYRLLRRQGYELSFKPYHGTRGPGRWYKQFDGSAVYFGRAKSVTNRVAYQAAVEKCREFERGRQAAAQADEIGRSLRSAATPEDAQSVFLVAAGLAKFGRGWADVATGAIWKAEDIERHGLLQELAELPVDELRSLCSQPIGLSMPTPPPTPKHRGPMLHAMIDSYANWFAADATRARKSVKRMWEVTARIKSSHPDVPVKQLSRLWIDQAVQHWKNRPAALRGKNKGKPISTYTVMTHVQYLRQLFNWMSDNEETTGFAEPKKMDKLFRYQPDPIDEIEQLTVPEIEILYAVGSAQQRMYLLFGVTCGVTQKELGVAGKDEFDFKAQLWNHRRNKTKKKKSSVVTSHWL
jgi:hypothetical protein